MFDLQTKWTCAIVSVTLLNFAVYTLYYLRKRHENKKDCEVNEVVIFHSGFSNCNVYCPIRSSTNLECCKRSVQKLMNYIKQAKTSIDICLYLFTCPELADAILFCVKRRHVIVRVIIDGADESITSQISFLLKHGVHVRYKESEYIMHNKFILIDKKILMSGSCNWTNSSFFANLENVIITSRKRIVGEFSRHFDNIWIQFDKTENTSKEER